MIGEWRDAAYGLRGVRVGEASHPGPSDSESDTVSLPGSESSARVSEGGEHADDPPLLPPIAFVMPPRAVLVEGFASLDEFDLRTVFQRRAVVMRTMRTVPPILRGPFQNALRIAMDEAIGGIEVLDELRQERAWKLFLLLPRMLLQRPGRGGLVPRSKIEDRLRLFAEGRWADLVNESIQSTLLGSEVARRKRRRQEDDDVVRRAARAEKLVSIGELSAARQALEGASVAPGTLRTLQELTNPEKRPAWPRSPIPPDIDGYEPEEQLDLSSAALFKNIRKARRGAAGGPSGMTVEHLRPLLECDRALDSLHKFAHIMARGEVPDRIEPVVRLGRLTALRKPDGGVRGIVVGDVLRRLVARTIAQQIADQVEAATAPFQYALKTRAGSECVAHILQHLTDLDPRATIVSVDGIGAFDLVSRNAMLRGLLSIEDGGKVLPFVRMFYGQRSIFLWEDEVGDVHDIPQGEGGEQGDPLMPLLFSLAQHAALVATQEQLRPGEFLFAFLDDIYIVCLPDRVGDIHAVLQEELYRHARISIHLGKTKVWNSGGEEPEACAVWRGDPTLPVALQGVKILGTPVGHEAFILHNLAEKTAAHSVLLDRIPAIENVQAAWLLLLFCAAAKIDLGLCRPSRQSLLAVPLSNPACARQAQCENDRISTVV